jgi:hypothetical protein
MTPEELRLECLKLVLQSANASGVPLVETSQLISRARAYADFVLNQGDRGSVDSANGTPAIRMPVGDGLRDTPISSPLEAGSILTIRGERANAG